MFLAESDRIVRISDKIRRRDIAYRAGRKLPAYVLSPVSLLYGNRFWANKSFYERA